MQLRIRRAGVIGSGTMGAGIAGHLANCGIPSLLLDIVPSELTEEEKARGLDRSSPQFRSRIAADAVKAMPKARPAPLYLHESAALITPGNLDDDFDKLADVDWIIEAVPEQLEIKRPLFERLESIHREGQIVSSNTSGIALKDITEGRGKQFLSDVLLTHFFNPPRYMHLLELVAGEHTDEDLFAAFVDFAERLLGKGVVVGRDTPNFIANRIGCFDMTIALRLAQELGLSVAEADAIAGLVMGRPKSGVFRLFDIVGVDVVAHINANLHATAPEDEMRDVFEPIPLLSKMIDEGRLGEKTGGGFYKRTRDSEGKRVILSLNLESFEYGAGEKPEFGSLSAVKGEADLGKRLKVLVESDDVVGKYIWGVLSHTLCYAANRAPEISGDLVGVDNAIRWGYNWEQGPFELWDTIGVRYIADRLERANRDVPELVRKLLDSGNESFYGFEEERPVSFSPVSHSFSPVPQRPRVTVLAHLKKAGRVIKPGEMASVIDLGDGIVCLEFHSKANTISSEVVELLRTACEEAERNFQGLVVGNQGANFCLGADLKEILGSAREGRFESIAAIIEHLQTALMSLKYCRVPTVAAIHGMVLGGGCELTMQSDRIQAAPETQIGLVEVGVGLIPAAGGCKEWAIRCDEWAGGVDSVPLFPVMDRALEMIGMAKKSGCAEEARKMGFLRPSDGITMNRDSLIYSAKQVALQMSEQGYHPPLRRSDIRVLGRGGAAEFKVRFNMWRQGGFISEYDEFLGNKVAHVLCGGDVVDNTEVSEQYLLDLERETFLSLTGEEQTMQRVEHTLKTGRPLKN
jgi:3-hydroxyacyl-CoA dehydrogenase